MITEEQIKQAAEETEGPKFRRYLFTFIAKTKHNKIIQARKVIARLRRKPTPEVRCCQVIGMGKTKWRPLAGWKPLPNPPSINTKVK